MKTLLEEVNLAIMANGGSEFRNDWCQCDPAVGAVPCEYCATRIALIHCYDFLIKIKKNMDAPYTI